SATHPHSNPLPSKILFDKPPQIAYIHLLAPPYNPSVYVKSAMLVPPDELLKPLLVLPLRPPHQFAVVGSLDRRNTASRPLGLGSTQGLWFWDVCHGFLVTPN